MSSIHPSHRRVRHLRQIVCRGIQRTDPEGCFFVISSNGKELYCSGVSRDCHNPHWDALPVSFLDEHSNAVSFTFQVHGWSSSEVLFSADIDMRSLQFLNKTFAGLPALKSGPTVLFRCQDGIYDTTGAPLQEVDDWVVVKEVTTSSARQERTTVDVIQGSGMVLASLKIELEMLQHRFQQVQWEANNSVPCAASPLVNSDAERAINDKKALAADLRRAIAERKALHAHRATCVQSQARASETSAVLTAGLPDSNVNARIEAVRTKRTEMIGSLSGIFTIAENKINGFALPEKEGLPESPEHAIALGHVVHLMGIICEIAALSPPHPMIVCGDHSRIAERVGLPLDMYIPLYVAKGSDKVRLKRGVELLKENVMCVVAAVTSGRVAEGATFTQTLSRILSC